MMDLHQAADVYGCCEDTLRRFCKDGRIQGAKKIRKPGCCRPAWFIPKDAIVPRIANTGPTRSVPKKSERRPFVPSRRISLRRVRAKDRKRAAFIWKNQSTMTIGQLARNLEISSQEVTALFDLGFSLFSRAGTGNEPEEG